MTAATSAQKPTRTQRRSPGIGERSSVLPRPEITT